MGKSYRTNDSDSHDLAKERNRRNRTRNSGDFGYSPKRSSGNKKFSADDSDHTESQDSQRTSRRRSFGY